VKLKPQVLRSTTAGTRFYKLIFPIPHVRRSRTGVHW
jgi:hypothetical protein